jgi:hypothetical protein
MLWKMVLISFISRDPRDQGLGDQTYQQRTNQPKDTTDKRKRLHNPPINALAHVILPIPLEDTTTSIVIDPFLENGKDSEVSEGGDEIERIVEES